MRALRITHALVILSLLGAVAGCSSDDDGTPPAPTATTGPAQPTSTFTQTAVPTATPVPNTPTVTHTAPPPPSPTATDTATAEPTSTPTVAADFSGTYESTLALANEQQAFLRFTVHEDSSITGTVTITGGGGAAGIEPIAVTGSVDGAGNFTLSGEGVDLSGTLPTTPGGQGTVSGTIGEENVSGTVTEEAEPPTATPTTAEEATPTETATPEPTPTATQGSGGLGVRELTAVRNPEAFVQSQFRTSALGGFDVSVDPWLPATFRLQAGDPDDNGIATVRLVDDVVIGFPVVDTSIACFRFSAEGSTGELACQAGRGKSLLVSADSNGSGPPDPTVVTLSDDPSTPAGSLYLTFLSSFANLPIGSDPEDCLEAEFSEPSPGAWATGVATAEIMDSRPAGETISLSSDGQICNREQPELNCGGEPFDCADWTNPNGPGMVVHPVLGFDQPGLGGGDVANLLVILGGDLAP